MLQLVGGAGSSRRQGVDGLGGGKGKLCKVQFLIMCNDDLIVYSVKVERQPHLASGKGHTV